ncbi:MAG: tRNA (adenosine(37)-N6)-dimethylallyltransferase MiaA [Nitrospirae bacterium]|nr:tRNA (adenosine(37)-N6)-dimethylallyltransferase MiaA [Nitrospirota bacterium]
MLKEVIILLGPTGVGKTGVSLLLAKALDTEIISADSMQIYRYMDIGTAKPTSEEKKLVKHHMIDIIDPWETYSTGRYIKEVVPIIDKLHSKGKIPIIVGGTGLYIKAMTRGIFSGPPADWLLREELLSLETEEKGILYTFLKALDPKTANKITLNDKRRIIRAIEVYLKSNLSMSEMQRIMTKPLQYEFIKIGLYKERKELYRIIEHRVNEMISKGLVEEVKNVMSVIKKYGETVSIKNHVSNITHYLSMQAIGYKEIELYLEGYITLEEAIRLIKRATKRYAKRQLTWFRKEEEIHWIDITGIFESKEIFKKVQQTLDGLGCII